MVLTIIPALLLIFAILTGFMYLHIKEITTIEAKKEINLIANGFASQMETELLTYFDMQKQFNIIFERYEDINININEKRKFYLDLSYDILKQNEKILAVLVDFDKNAFDELDDNYKKSVNVFPRSGRFNFTFHRGNGDIELEKEQPGKSIESFLKYDYYHLARIIKKPVITDPYYYDYNNEKTKTGTLMITISSPIFNKNNEVIGVTGIDISLENYIELTQKIKPFGVGYAALHSSKGIYLSHPDKTLLGKSITDNSNFSKTLSNSIYKQLLKKQKFEMDVTNKEGKKILISVPVATGIEGEELMLTLIVPYHIITAKVTPVFLQFITIIALALVFIVIIIIMVANKLSKPLNKLSKEASKLTEGNLSLRLDNITSKDEIGDLSRVIVFVNQAIKELTGEMNKIILAVKSGKLNIHTDETRFKGVYRLLIKGINEVTSVLVEPLELTMDMIFVVDIASLKYSFIAGGFKEMLGYNSEELINKSVKEIVTPESFASIKDIIATNLERYYSGEIDVPQVTLEAQQYHKNGSLVWVEISAKIIFGEDNKPIKVIAMSRLISDRKKLETALKESERRFRLMAENTNDMFWTMDVSTQRFTYMSGACYEITGFTTDEYLNMTLKDIMPEHSLELIMQTLENEIDKALDINEQSEGEVFEIQQYHKDGYLIWVEISFKLLPVVENNSIIEIVAMTRLIDKRKKLEIALKESEARHRMITENMRDGLFMMDLSNMKYIYKNDTGVEITGYSAEETIEKTIYTAFPPESVEKIQDIITGESRKYYSGELKNLPYAVFEVQQYHKDGSLVWVEISARALPPNKKGILTTMVGTTRNIDDRKQIEAKILEQNIELEQQHEDLIEQKKELEQANQTKNRFFSIISHDLKNSVTSLSNIASIFEDYYEIMTQEQIEKNIKTFIKSTSNIEKMLSNLLNWARSSTDNIILNLTKNEIKDIVSITFENVEIQAQNKSIELVFENNTSDKYIHCDSDMINTILRNLISNAIKFSPKGKKISVIVDNYLEDDRYILFAVKDQGMGIDSETIEKLFRIDTKITTKGTGGETGTGLGLILCKEFIDKHNCKIWVESEVGVGTEFKFTMTREHKE